MALFVLAGLIACSEPPDKERQQAEGALQAAREADAAAYAPEPLHAAEAALQKYDEAVAQRDYRLALNNALEARDQAYAAVKDAGNKKAELRGSAERLVAELEAQLRAANAALNLPPGRRPPAATAERLRTAIDAGSSALQEARTRLGDREYQRVIGMLAPIVEGLRKDLPQADEPSSKKKK